MKKDIQKGYDLENLQKDELYKIEGGRAGDLNVVPPWSKWFTRELCKYMVAHGF